MGAFGRAAPAAPGHLPGLHVLRRHPGHALSSGPARGLRGVAGRAGLRGPARRRAPLPLAVPVAGGAAEGDRARPTPAPAWNCSPPAATSGRAAIVPRDRTSTDLAVESFSLSFQRYFGVTADHTAIFMMPKRTRVAMARMTRTGVQRVGLSPDRVHFTYPLPRLARPDPSADRAGPTERGGGEASRDGSGIR